MPRRSGRLASASRRCRARRRSAPRRQWGSVWPAPRRPWRARPAALSRARREVLVVGRNGFDVVALALGLRADAASLIDRRLCLLGALGRCALSGQRIRHQDRSDSPCGDRALGIVLEHVAEGLLPGRIPEGMQHGHGTLERRLHLRIATGREGHLAQRGGFWGGGGKGKVPQQRRCRIPARKTIPRKRMRCLREMRLCSTIQPRPVRQRLRPARLEVRSRRCSTISTGRAFA